MKDWCKGHSGIKVKLPLFAFFFRKGLQKLTNYGNMRLAQIKPKV
jgi:hypothetical protein